MSELDGTWRVERVGGLLPPLPAVTKHIEGTTGTTRIAGIAGVAFVVEGHALRYKAPLDGFVDYVERDGPIFRGRATFRGKDFGTFVMRPLDRGGVMGIHELLVKHLDEAHAMELSVGRMLDGMIGTTDDPELLEELEHHKIETEGHAHRMKQRLEAHGGTPSVVKQAGGILAALLKLPLDMVRSEKAGRNARDGYATEHLEIAAYELLSRIAEKANDAETVQACREILVEEKAMAAVLEANWDKFVELSLKEEGIRAG